MSDTNERSGASDGSAAIDLVQFALSGCETVPDADSRVWETYSPVCHVPSQKNLTLTDTERHQRFNAALVDLLQESHQRGLVEGLAVARKIRDWLTRQPDREWQRQVRGWADAEIAKAERKKP